MSFLDAIRDVLPENGILCDEMTQVGYVSWFGFPVHAPRTLITSGFSGTLGAGFPTALGVKVAHPDRPVVALTGDGGFLFGGAELATAVQLGINLVDRAVQQLRPTATCCATSAGCSRAAMSGSQPAQSGLPDLRQAPSACRPGGSPTPAACATR